MENKENRCPKKRQRTENWLEEDKYLLKELVKERVYAIENKNTDTNTNKKKLAAWNDLHSNFNSMCKGVQRTIAQLKSQWGIIKMGAKKIKTAERQAIIKTGGGPPPLTVDESADDISTWLPNEFAVDNNEFDSDSNQISQIPINVKSTASTPQVFEILPSTSTSQIYVETPPSVQDLTSEDISSNIYVETKQNRESLYNVIVTDNIDIQETEEYNKKIKEEPQTSAVKHKSSRKIKNQKLAPAVNMLTQKSMSTIVEVDTRCRQELHEIQLENERKKGRNLDLEYELLQLKLKFYQNKNK